MPTRCPPAGGPSPASDHGSRWFHARFGSASLTVWAGIFSAQPGCAFGARAVAPLGPCRSGRPGEQQERPMAKNPAEQFEIPPEMRAVAEKSVEQAKQAFEGYLAAAHRTV